MMNERTAWRLMEEAEDRAVQAEEEWDAAGLSDLLPEGCAAGKLAPGTVVYTHDQLVAAMMAVYYRVV